MRCTVIEHLQVSIAYVGADEQILRPLETRMGTSVREAIERSGVLLRCPEIDLAVNKVGIFGKVVKLDQILEEGDRVEIYRPLIADPKEARKQRAVGQTQSSEGGRA
jgi:uncharacterized protein